MKNKILISFLFFFLGSITVSAQEKTEKIKIYGNCGMCKERIETAAKSAKGVSTADWDKETQTLYVTFNNSDGDIFKIAKYVVKAGHDTDLYKLQAKNNVYAKLPKCCQYARASKIFDTKERPTTHNHQHDSDGHNHSH